MFISKKRNIIITQFDHTKLSGVLAQNWGNENFDKPVIDLDAFVKGVTLHDIAYGDYDNYPIGVISNEQWSKLTLAGSKHKFENPVVDIVAKLHLKRLLDDDDVLRDEILNTLEKRIAARLQETDYSIQDFMWADCITDFCDWVSFNYCFEKEFEDRVEVYARRNSTVKTELKFLTNPAGEIIVDPWPFSVESLNGYITAYNEKGYPENLKPLSKKYHVKQYKNPSIKTYFISEFCF